MTKDEAHEEHIDAMPCALIVGVTESRLTRQASDAIYELLQMLEVVALATGFPLTIASPTLRVDVQVRAECVCVCEPFLGQC